MIQFNLLPDIKLEFQKSQAVKRSVLMIAVIVTGVCVAITVLLATIVYVGQKTHLNGLNSDIGKFKDQLNSTQDLTKVLTVQNQLISLTCNADEIKANQKPCLHDKKPVATRLFGYMGQIVPNNVTISKLDVKFSENSINFTGNADSLATVNKFVDTLKFTTYTTPDIDKQNAGKDASTIKYPNAFTDVVLTNFSRTDKETTYTIDLTYDVAIFNSTKDTKLIVPAGAITTRSTVEKPTNLFVQPQSQGNK